MYNYEKLTWITNHPKPLKSMWPRRAGVKYIEGFPNPTDRYTVEELLKMGIIGVYVDMPLSAYRKLPIIKKPERNHEPC